MKAKFWFLILLAVGFASCSFFVDSDDMEVITGEATDITPKGVVLNGEIKGGDITYFRSATYGMLISNEKDKVKAHEGRVLKGSNLQNGVFSVETNALTPLTEYFYCAYLTINDSQHLYGEILSFVTPDIDRGEQLDGHGFVDLGLSVKWATCNIGADEPQLFGDYFAWGETAPKSEYSWPTYSLCNGTQNSLTKYCLSGDYGVEDHKLVLEPEDDAAVALWGNNWRMPTKEEWTELERYTTHAWERVEGAYGLKATSIINGNSIFLPAGGSIRFASHDQEGVFCHFWTSSLDDFGVNSCYSHYVYIGDFQVWSSRTDSRCFGRSVRPVHP